MLQPIEFRFEPFGICDSFVTHPNRTDILIFGSYRPAIRTLRFKISPDILRKTKQIEISSGCGSIVPNAYVN